MKRLTFSIPWDLIRAVSVRSIALGLILGTAHFVFTADGRKRFDHLEGEVGRMSELNTELATNNERLRLTIDGIRHDDRFLERLARQELGMVGKGEVLYRFIAPATAAP